MIESNLHSKRHHGQQRARPARTALAEGHDDSGHHGRHQCYGVGLGDVSGYDDDDVVGPEGKRYGSAYGQQIVDVERPQQDVESQQIEEHDGHRGVGQAEARRQHVEKVEDVARRVGLDLIARHAAEHRVGPQRELARPLFEFHKFARGAAGMGVVGLRQMPAFEHREEIGETEHKEYACGHRVGHGAFEERELAVHDELCLVFSFFFCGQRPATSSFITRVIRGSAAAATFCTSSWLTSTISPGTPESVIIEMPNTSMPL